MSYGGFEYGGATGGGYGGGFDGGGMGGDAYGSNGGGFMAQDDGKASKGSDKKSRDKNTLLPLSVKQILTASKEDDTYKVDGQELFNVKIIGTVESWTETSTYCAFQVNDGSGSIECKQWIDKAAAGAGANSIGASLKEGALVRVVGNLREFEGKIHVLVYDAKVVEDWNEMTHHLLEIVMTHCQATKGPVPGSAAATAAAKQGGGGFSSPSGNAGSGLMFGQQPAMSGQRMNAGGNNSNQAFNDAVHSVYRQGDSNGLNYDQVMSKLNHTGNPTNMETLRRAVAALCDEGRLYSTLDDMTYAAT